MADDHGASKFDALRPTFLSALHDAGYQTALFGKWHLGHGDIHDPRGFDSWDEFLAFAAACACSASARPQAIRLRGCWSWADRPPGR